MCGRISLTRRRYEDVVEELDVTPDPAHAAVWRPRYNIAPTQQHWIVAREAAGDARRHLTAALWGMSPAKLINAKAEALRQVRAFRHAIDGHRCVVPVDGFFEWTGDKKDRRPIWFHRPDGKLILLAGLWELQGTNPHFAVITTQANATVSPIHDRMPAILDGDDVERWLRAANPYQAASLLHAAPADSLVATPVSRRVNSVRNDDESCLGPPEPAQPTLL